MTGLGLKLHHGTIGQVNKNMIFAVVCPRGSFSVERRKAKETQGSRFPAPYIMYIYIYIYISYTQKVWGVLTIRFLAFSLTIVIGEIQNSALSTILNFWENHLKVTSPQNGPKMVLGGPHCDHQHDPQLRADYGFLNLPCLLSLSELIPGFQGFPSHVLWGPSNGPLGSRTPFLVHGIHSQSTVRRSHRIQSRHWQKTKLSKLVLSVNWILDCPDFCFFAQ